MKMIDPYCDETFNKFNKFNKIINSYSTSHVIPDINIPYRKKITIANVIFNPPATIVFWSDDTKTVVKCGDGEVFDAEKGLAMAIAKRLYGDNQGSYYNVFKKYMVNPTYSLHFETPRLADCIFALARSALNTFERRSDTDAISLSDECS